MKTEPKQQRARSTPRDFDSQRFAIQGTGQALDAQTRDTLEPRFGHSFGDVRVFADGQAAQSAEALGAKAYTVGADIVFAAGQYNPVSSQGQQLLAHELTHVVQRSKTPNSGVQSAISHPSDATEREAESVSKRVTSGGQAEVHATAPATISCDVMDWLEEAGSGIAGAAGTVYDGYQKSTDFKSLQSGNPKLADESKGQWGEGFIRGGINGEIDSALKMSAAGNQKMVDQSQGHWYEGLAQGAAWLNNGSAQVTGGLLKGVGDIGFGLANGIAHPIDAAGGLLGIAEHNLMGAGTVLKAGHGLVDLGLDAAGVHYERQGQYGSSFGELGNHLFNPLQQMKDDQKFNTNLVQGIVDPDRKGWAGLEDKPVETITRALTNIVPIVAGVAESAGPPKAGTSGVRPPSIAEPPPTLRSPFLPEGVPAPKPFNPVIPEVTPGVVDPHAPTLRPPVAPPEVIVGPDTQISPGGTPPSTVRQPVPTQPGIGPIDLPPDTIPQSRPGGLTKPGLGPENPAIKPQPISQLDPAFDSISSEPRPSSDRGQLGPKTADGAALEAKPNSNVPASDLDFQISPRQPPPTPSVEELLRGLEGQEKPQFRGPISETEPSIDGLLRSLHEQSR